MLQEVMWAYCDQFHVVFVLPALWYYDQQKSEVGRDRDWEEWDSGCHRTSDSDSSLNFDIHNIFLDMVNIFRITIVTCRPIWRWSVLTHPLLLKSWTACFDMKEDRNKKSGVICVRWVTFLEVASLLPRGTYSKWKSITWVTSSHEGDESTDLFRDMDLSEQRRTGTRIFSSYQEGEVWWQ